MAATRKKGICAGIFRWIINSSYFRIKKSASSILYSFVAVSSVGVTQTSFFIDIHRCGTVIKDLDEIIRIRRASVAATAIHFG